MEQLLNDIIKKQAHVFFISPHLDDAVLSAGGVLSYLAGKTPITLITIFTSAGKKPYTLSAKGFLRDCGYVDANQLFNIRKKEDETIAKKLNIVIKHLDYIDGSFRTYDYPVVQQIGKFVPEINHLYPLGRKVFDILHPIDKKLIKKLAKELVEITRTEKNKVVFSPIGSVKHMDHTITTKASQIAFPDAIYWADYPYITKPHATNKTIYVWDRYSEEKKELIAEYKTQLASLYPKRTIEVIPETYYH